MEKLTEKEEKMLKKLTEKKKKIDKHEKEFWKEVDSRKSEILEHWGVTEEQLYSAKNFSY